MPNFYYELSQNKNNLCTGFLKEKPSQKAYYCS